MSAEVTGLIGALVGSAVTLAGTYLGWKRAFLDSRRLSEEQRLNDLRSAMIERLGTFFRRYYRLISSAEDKIKAFDHTLYTEGSDAEKLLQSIADDLVVLPPDIPRDITYVCPKIEAAIDWFDWMNEVLWLQLTCGGDSEELFLEIYRIMRDCELYAHQLEAITSSLLVSLMLGVSTKPFSGSERYRGVVRAFKLDLNEDGIVTIIKPTHSDEVYSKERMY